MTLARMAVAADEHGAAVRLVHAAAWRVSGGDPLEMRRGEQWRAGRLLLASDDEQEKASGAAVVAVQPLTLDDAHEHDANVRLLLVDSGGVAEDAVLDGAARLLGACAVDHIVLRRLTLGGDVFAKLRHVLALVNRCDYRGFTFVEHDDDDGFDDAAEARELRSLASTATGEKKRRRRRRR